MNSGSLGAMEKRSNHLSYQILMELSSPTVQLLPDCRSVARDPIFLHIHEPTDGMLGCQIEKFLKYPFFNQVAQRDEVFMACQPMLDVSGPHDHMSNN